MLNDTDSKWHQRLESKVRLAGSKLIGESVPSDETLGQLCRISLCNAVNPSSSCGSVTIFLYDCIFYNTDGTQFDTGTAHLTLNYPQCTLITNNDPNVCVNKCELGIAYVQDGKIFTSFIAFAPKPPMQCLNELPEIDLPFGCPAGEQIAVLQSSSRVEIRMTTKQLSIGAEDQKRVARAKSLTNELPSNVRLVELPKGWLLYTLDNAGLAVGLTFVPF